MNIGGMQGRIVAVGEVVADIYRSATTRPGELPLIARPGGAPANLAVVAARLGAEAAFTGRVGEDLFGDFILKALGDEGVNVSGITRAGGSARTSIAFVEITATGERSFTFYRSDPAADELLSPEDLTPETLAGAAFLTFGSIPLRREPSRAAIHAAVDLARHRRVPVAFDVNLRVHLWESAEMARAEVYPLLARSQVVKLSDDELEPLLGTADPEAAAADLLQRGAALVFITLGAQGAFYATQDLQGRVPSFPVMAVDTTGAGDAFLAAALVHLSKHPWDEQGVREAALRGAAAGAIVCTGTGAAGATLSSERLEELLAGTGFL